MARCSQASYTSPFGFRLCEAQNAVMSQCSRPSRNDSSQKRRHLLLGICVSPVTATTGVVIVSGV